MSDMDTSFNHLLMPLPKNLTVSFERHSPLQEGYQGNKGARSESASFRFATATPTQFDAGGRGP